MGIPFLPFLLGLSGDSRRVEESAQTATYSLPRFLPMLSCVATMLLTALCEANHAATRNAASPSTAV